MKLDIATKLSLFYFCANKLMVIVSLPDMTLFGTGEKPQRRGFWSSSKRTFLEIREKRLYSLFMTTIILF